MSDGWRNRLADPDPWRAPSPLPGPILTPRAEIRAYRKGDGARVHEAISAAREGILPWMLWVLTDHQSVEDSIHFVERAMRGPQAADCTDFMVGAFAREGGRLLGGLGYHRIDPASRTGEVGYWIRGDAHGQGLCTELTGHFVSSGVTPADAGGWGFRRVTLFCDAKNIGSRRVAEKLGFRLESRCRADRYAHYEGIEERYHDNLGFAVLADEWDTVNHRAVPGISWDDASLQSGTSR